MENNWLKSITELANYLIASLFRIAPGVDLHTHNQFRPLDATDQLLTSRGHVASIDMANVADKSVKMLGDLLIWYHIASYSQGIPLIGVTQTSLRRRNDWANTINKLEHLVIRYRVESLGIQSEVLWHCPSFVVLSVPLPIGSAEGRTHRPCGGCLEWEV